MAKDYYKILGVDKKADKGEIKKAFRKLAQEYHPDKGGDEAKFKEINEAYQVLGDEKKRAEYDTYGQTFGGGAGFDPSGFDFNDFARNGGVDLGDIFGEFFGGRRSRTARGSDISVDIEIPFKDSVFGTTRNIKIGKNSTCDSCSGSGAEAGSKLKKCDRCAGNGRIHETRKTILGSFSAERVCDSCNGSGEVPETSCKSCKGAGIKEKAEEIELNIPAGINSGEMIRMTGMGEAISMGSPGDLYIRIHVESDKRYQRQGHDLILELPVKLTDALLGAEYNVATLDGEIKLTIPAGISHGEILRVKDKGVPYGEKKRGNLLVKVILKVPASLSRRAKEHIKKLREEGI